ncbi:MULTISPECIES: DEAD/DEAH box helicase [unclassified Mesorhizobium]|uniref:DEAD/DEAH box helicase n=1 Tax=unclassified Mesorhizobium TaxID=325217 RepID=UPI0033370E1E
MMAGEVRIEFDPTSQAILLRGDSHSILRHPLFGTYLRSAGAHVLQDAISLPTDEQALHARYQELTKLIGRSGFTLIEGGDGGTLAKVRREEDDFKTFAAAAAAIWRSEVDTDNFASFVARVNVACPARTFYRKQLLAAFHLAFAQNACNFSVPGAGKTSIVYAAYAYLAGLPPEDPRNVDHLLIVGPLSAFKAWEDEFKEIFGRAARSKRIAGFVSPSDRSAYLRGVSYTGRAIELTLTTYASLAANLEEFKTFLGSPLHRTMVVLDEAHNIKRQDGYWSNAAMELAPLARSRVVLTGTPAPNGYEDLANLFRFIYPKRNVIGFSSAALKAMSGGAMPAGIDRLKDRIRPFYTRIRKSDLGLSPASESRPLVDLSPKHRRIYDGIERTVLPQLRSAIQGGRSSLVRARLMRLRQAAVNPALLLRPLEEEGLLDPDGVASFSVAELEIADLVSTFDPHSELNRLSVATDLVRKIISEQGKVVIWSYFVGNLALLKQALEGAADFVEVVTGSTPVADDTSEIEEELALPTRESLINRFHAAGETSILIANPQAVGESISLHKACRSAIYFDRDFNAGKFIQSKDRIHRYNPVPLGDVSYHLLMAEGTLDTAINRRLIQKEQRLSELVDAEEIPLFTLEDEETEQGADVRAILEDYERRKTI